MENNKRLEIYEKLIESYHCFESSQYDRGIYVLQSILYDIEKITKKIQNNDYYYREWYINYTRKTMDYSRAIPKSNQSRQKRFIEWFHKAIFNISKNNYIHSYSYIRDIKTIMEELNDNNRTS